MRNFWLFSLTIVVLSSCYKDKIVFVPDQHYKINNDILLANLVGSQESYIVNIDRQNHIALPGNVSLIFPKNKTRLYDNTLVTGQVKIEFKEYAYPKSGLMNYPEASTNTSWINSEKAILLKVTQDDRQLLLTEPMTLYFPSITSNSDMKIYTLNAENTNAQWNISPVLTNELEYGNWLVGEEGVGQQTKEITGYKLKLAQTTEKILIGSPLGNKGALQNKCTIETPKGFTDSNSIVYFIGSQINMVIKLDYDEVTRQFYTNKGIIDQNIAGKMVIIGQISDDEYYFGMTNAVLGEDTRILISGNTMPLENIKAALSKL